MGRDAALEHGDHAAIGQQAIVTADAKSAAECAGAAAVLDKLISFDHLGILGFLQLDRKIAAACFEDVHHRALTIGERAGAHANAFDVGLDPHLAGDRIESIAEDRAQVAARLRREPFREIRPPSPT